MAAPKDLIDPRKLYPNTLRFLENSTLEFLQILFSSFPDCFHYDRDGNATQIKIEGRTTDNLETVDTRPKIVVSRGAVGWQNRGIGNFVGSQNLSMRQRQYADINDGTIGISCFSRERLEAEDIAWIVYASIKRFRTALQQYGFLTIHAQQVGQTGMVMKDARPELWVTPVLVRASVTDNWTVTKTDPVKLRDIIIGVRPTVSNGAGTIDP